MSLTYCGELVRKHDPDRFLISLFAPPDTRPALWALYAFNFEIARTREVVTETQLGLIRLQWWRDALASGAGQGNPVLEAILAAKAQYALPSDLFDTLIYAREFDLEDRQPADMKGLLNYADFTSTPLMTLSQLVIPAKAGIQPAASAADMTQCVATAYALTGLLRAVPAHLRQRRCLLPANMTPPVEELYAGKGLEKLQPVVREIVTEACRLLKLGTTPAKAGVWSARSAFINTGPDPRLRGGGALLARLHEKLAQMYLSQIKKADYNLFDPRLAVPPLARGLRLWWTSR